MIEQKDVLYTSGDYSLTKIFFSGNNYSTVDVEIPGLGNLELKNLKLSDETLKRVADELFFQIRTALGQKGVKEEINE